MVRFSTIMSIISSPILALEANTISSVILILIRSVVAAVLPPPNQHPCHEPARYSIISSAPATPADVTVTPLSSSTAPPGVPCLSTNRELCSCSPALTAYLSYTCCTIASFENVCLTRDPSGNRNATTHVPTPGGSGGKEANRTLASWMAFGGGVDRHVHKQRIGQIHTRACSGKIVHEQGSGNVRGLTEEVDTKV